jgi:hypothetical protein
VTDVAVSDATDDSGNAIKQAHVVVTTHDLTWADNVSLQSELRRVSRLGNSTSHTLCAGAINGLQESVAHGYDPSDNGDCAGPLGESCSNAIAGTLSKSGKDPNGCPSDIDFSSLDECKHLIAGSSMSILSGCKRALWCHPDQRNQLIALSHRRDCE